MEFKVGDKFKLRPGVTLQVLRSYNTSDNYFHSPGPFEVQHVGAGIVYAVNRDRHLNWIETKNIMPYVTNEGF